MSTRKPSVSRKTANGDSAVRSAITPAEVLEPLLWLLERVGVSRREVLATVRALAPARPAAPVTVVRRQVGYWSRLSVRWAADPRFLGPDGRPRDLSFV